MKYRDAITGEFKKIRIRATDELPVGSEIDVDDNTTIPAGWEETTDPNEYSTTEQRIGTWIDGKPIYRKVIDIGSLPSSGNKLVPHGLTIANVNIIKIYGIAKSENVYLPLPNVASDNNDDSMFVTEGNILIHVESNRSSFTGYAILEYTKTTD